MQDLSRSLSVADTARLLEVSNPTLRAYIKEGRITAFASKPYSLDKPSLRVSFSEIERFTGKIVELAADGKTASLIDRPAGPSPEDTNE